MSDRGVEIAPFSLSSATGHPSKGIDNTLRVSDTCGEAGFVPRASATPTIDGSCVTDLL